MSNPPDAPSLFSRPYLIGGILACCGAILFSTKAIFVKLAYNYEVDAVSLLMLRMLFSLPVFLLVGMLALNRRPEKWHILKGHFRLVIFLGILGYYIASYFDLEGLTYIDASLERIILFIYPTLVILLNLVFRKLIPNKIQISSVIITYVGIIIAFRGNLMINDQQLVLKGGLLVLISAFTYSLYLVGTGKLAGTVGTQIYNSFAMTAASIAIIVHNSLIHGFNLLSFVPEVYGYALLISFFSTIIPSYLIVEGIRLIGANNSSIIGSVGPISTIILAVIFLGEALTGIQIIGSLIVIIGVLLTLVSSRKETVHKKIPDEN